MSKPKIYISGPITGRPSLNKENFDTVRNQLVMLGYNAALIVVPHELFDGIDVEKYKWSDYMKGCIAELVKCDVVLTLEDWPSSEGATLEVHIARHLNIPVTDARYFMTTLKKDITHSNDT
jgi:hypothetical protein